MYTVYKGKKKRVIYKKSRAKNDAPSQSRLRRIDDSRVRMRGTFPSWLGLLALLAMGGHAIECGDGDVGCIERECSAFCSQWTCKHPLCPGCGPEVGCPAHPPSPPPPPPLPSLPPWDLNVAPGELHIAASGSKLYANGVRLHIKGVNWFGSEGRAGPPLGLDSTHTARPLSSGLTGTPHALPQAAAQMQRRCVDGALMPRPPACVCLRVCVWRSPPTPTEHKIAWYMRFLKENGFNAIRFLFNHETILADSTLEPPNEAKYGVGAPWEAPELEAMKYLDSFGKLASVAAEYGVLVMMACHRLNPKAWPGEGKWYDAVTTEARVMQSWDRVAAKLCSHWNVFAVDLQNEPHASSWGKGLGDGSDWGHAAERLGNRVLSRCPRWLIMVEGVGYKPGAPGMDSGGAGIWWGENLAGAREQPVRLSDPSKLVYSPHTYGPSVYLQGCVAPR